MADPQQLKRGVQVTWGPPAPGDGSRNGVIWCLSRDRRQARVRMTVFDMFAGWVVIGRWLPVEMLQVVIDAGERRPSAEQEWRSYSDMGGAYLDINRGWSNVDLYEE